jgi:N-acetylglucosamine malate deacetylase 2
MISKFKAWLETVKWYIFLRKTKPKLNTFPHLLCIVAHPDDETMICGGTLAALAACGVEIHVLCATRGEGGELGEPPLCERHEVGRIREAEMRCACRALGVKGVTFLNYIDPLVGPDNTLYPFTENVEEVQDRLLVHIRRLRPHILVTHGRDGEYGHPAHKLVHRAAWSAFEHLRQADNAPAYFYTIAGNVPGIDDHIFNASEPAHLVFNLEDTPWLDTKERAALCHVTQHGLFKRRRQAKTVREILRRVESLHRYWPPAGPHPPELTTPKSCVTVLSSVWEEQKEGTKLEQST